MACTNVRNIYFSFIYKNLMPFLEHVTGLELFGRKEGRKELGFTSFSTA